MPRKDGSLTAREARAKARREQAPLLHDGRVLDEKMRKPAKHISYSECPHCKARMRTGQLREHCLLKHPLRDMDGNEIDPAYRKQATPDDAMRIQEDKRREAKEQREKEAKKK